MTPPEKTCPQCGAQYEAGHRFCTLDGATLVSVQPRGDLIGTVIADRYLVTAKLGDGGMGQVYLAEHVRMKRKCAVKVMRPGLMSDPDAISRFNREAENASQVIHQNVAAVYDFGETSDGLIYLAMEYVEGESLARIIERERAIHPVRAAEIVRQAAEALDVAHSRGILHRDLKPENIMIAQTRERLDLVKIVDFGIARAMTSEAQRVTRTGSLVGTPEFMSPEQFAGDTLDSRSDLYSLALVAFNILTGATAYPSGTSKDNLIVRLTQPPRRLHEVKDLPWPEDLQRTFDKALASDPADRHDSVMEFSREMTAAIAAMPASQTGEIYLSALASALAARAAATPSRNMTPVGSPITGATPAIPASPTPSPERIEGTPQERRRPSPVLAIAATLLVPIAAAILWQTLKGGAADNSDSAQAGTGADSLTVAGVADTSGGPATSADSAASEQQVFDRMRAGVVSVIGSGGSGIAFLADRSGLLITASNVVGRDTTVSVMLDDTTRIRARVVAGDTANPVAVLAIAPTRCGKCAVLPIAAIDSLSALTPGSPILAIGSSRSRPRLIKGNIAALDAKSIRTTLKTDPAESGAPILSLGGEVIGMSASASAGRGTPREVHPGAVQTALAAAQRTVSTAGFTRPADSLLPVRPRTPFPAEPIASVAAVTNMDLLRRYRVEEGAFQLLVMTPPVMGWRDARAKAEAERLRGATRGGTTPARLDPIQGWRGWDACIRDRCAVVILNVVPDRTPFLYHKATEVLDFSRGAGNVRSLTLLRDGQPVEPIESTVIPAVINESAYLAQKKPVFSQGVAMYRAREFAPRPTGGVARYELVVVDATRPDRPTRIALSSGIIQAIINDFAPYGLTR